MIDLDMVKKHLKNITGLNVISNIDDQKPFKYNFRKIFPKRKPTPAQERMRRDLKVNKSSKKPIMLSGKREKAGFIHEPCYPKKGFTYNER